MTPEIALTLGIVVLAVVLFATEKLRVDVIALIILLTVAFTGLVTAEQAIEGFANPAVVTVWAVYIVSGGLFRTGVADMIGAQIIRLAGTSEPRLVAVIMLTCGTMSAFMNNIGATAVLLPAVAGISRQANIPLSRLLIPLSFSSLLGGNMTLIGTPPNILATAILAERGQPSFAFFDFAPIGIVVFGTGILFMVLFGRFLLPTREALEDVEASYHLRDYITEVRVALDSPLVGQTLDEARLGADYDLTVLTVLRDHNMQTAPGPRTRIRPEDVLVIQGTLDNLMEAQSDLGLLIEAEQKLGLVDDDDKAENEAHLLEATLAPGSPIAGQSLRRMQFRDRYGFTALAIRRHGEIITRRLRDVRLHFGDTLLLKGPRHRIRALQQGEEFLVLEPVRFQARRQHKIWLAIAILGLVLLLATIGGVNIALAMLLGALLMVLSGALTMEEAYQSIEWRSIFLIAGMLPLGTAMEQTGSAQYLANLMLGSLGPFGPMAVLAGVYIMASLITQPMSNAAATVLIVPIAIDIALSLGADPRAFALATVISASTSFITPVGHQANILVFGPGGYRFLDYTRVGLPLNIVIFAVTMIVLPILWPLF
jgi:di/tricarboxylate transporter